LAKVERNYATNYIRRILPVLCSVLGPGDGAAVGRIAARQIAMQYHGTVMAMLDGGGGAGPFGERLGRLLAAHGTPATVTAAGDDAVVRLERWRMFEGTAVPPEVFEAWNGLWEGLAAMEDVRLVVAARADLGDGGYEWHLRRTARPTPASS
jgi:hypothetical protein